MSIALLRKRWVRVAGIAALGVGGWMLFVYAIDLPVSDRVYYNCAICRAGKTAESLFLIPLRTRVDDNDFSRYYREHVDATHRHVWLFGGVSRQSRTGGVSAHGRSGPCRLYYEPAFEILKSLPDRRSRKVFFERLYSAYAADDGTPEGHATWLKTWQAIMKLNDAYSQDENRRDWPEQLKRVGLCPQVRSTHN